MTEKEFRKLVSEQEMPKIQKEAMLEEMKTLKDIISNYAPSHYTVIDMIKGGAFAKGTMLSETKNWDANLIIKPLVHKSFGITNQIIINDIVNALMIFLPEITKVSDIRWDESRNVLYVHFQDKEISIAVCYEEETKKEIIDIPDDFLVSKVLKEIQFIELANKDYTYFRNTVQIIKFYRDEQKLNLISGYALEILLYYALNEYFLDTRYEDYIHAFLKGLDDFILGKKIEVSPDMYQRLSVKKGTEFKKGYTILDVTNPNRNITEDINEIKIGDYRKLKKVLSKLVDVKTSIKNLTTGPVKLNVTPLQNSDGTMSWSYKIEDTNFSGNGGNMVTSEENIYTAIYKALLKGLKAVIDNGLNRKQVEVVTPKQDIWNKDQGLSNENNARRKNVLTFIDNNQIKIIK